MTPFGRPPGGPEAAFYKSGWPQVLRRLNLTKRAVRLNISPVNIPAARSPLIIQRAHLSVERFLRRSSVQYFCKARPRPARGTHAGQGRESADAKPLPASSRRWERAPTPPTSSGSRGSRIGRRRAGIADRPEEALRTPGSFKRTPGSLKRIPGSFKRTPGSFKRTPGSFKRTPGSF